MKTSNKLTVESNKDSTVYGVLLGFVVIFSGLVFLFSVMGIVVGTFTRNFSAISLIVAVISGAIIMLVASVIKQSLYNESIMIERTNKRIKAAVKNKYGIDIPLNSLHAGFGLNNSPIISKNANNEVIQVLLQLTNGDRDILAFVGGVEMPKLPYRALDLSKI